MASFDYNKSLGFIGIGAMGRPIVSNLAAKLPGNTVIYVFDVSMQTMNEVCTEYPGRILKGKSAREVANKSVREPTKPSIAFDYYFPLINRGLGRNYHHGP